MDRPTKILLAAIALGLWANASVTMLRPAQAQRADGLLSGAVEGIDQKLERLVTTFDRIALGTCANRKICSLRD